MIERRNRVRRIVCGGLVLGIFAALLPAAIEVAFVLATASGAFDGLGERIAFAVSGLLLAAAAGALAGLLLGAVVAAVDRAVSSLVGLPRRRVWAARIYTGVATPAVAMATAALFSGRRAQLLPAHDAIALAAGLTLLGGFYFALRVAMVLRARIVGAPAARGGLVAVALFAALVGVYLLDQRVLPRLYLPFHLGCEALAFALSAGALHALFLAARRTRSAAHVVAPAFTVAVGLLAVAGGAFALKRLARSESLRAVAYQNGCLLPRLLEGARAAGLTRGAGPPTVTLARAGSAGPLPPGPLLADTDVFLITVDALRADRLTARTAPNLAALAGRGVSFEHAYTQVPHTSFALATLLTGKYVHSLTALGEDPARHETLADVFQRVRYKTAAFFPPSVFFIDHQRFVEVEKSAYHFEYVKYEHMDAGGRTDQVIRFLESERPTRVFAWVHYFEPHMPYDLHDGHAPDGHPPATAIERYDGEVHFVDQEIARLLRHIESMRPGALIVVAADHGEEFGEHGGRYHGTTLFEEQVRVPLFFVALKKGLPARRIVAPVGLIDVAPTLLGLAGITPSARMRGQDLGPWMSPPGCPEARLAPTFAELGSQKLVASGSERLLCDVARDYCQLFDVASDPGEQKNLAGRPEGIPRAAALRARLAAWMADQSAFERLPVGEGDEERARGILERGRLGERRATGELGGLLGDPKLRAEAAAVLLELPDDPEIRGAIEEALRAEPDEVRLLALALRAGDRGPIERLAAYAARADADVRVRAETALALAALDGERQRAVPLLTRALDDPLPEEVEKRIIAALGASHDPAAAGPLVAHLDHVRTRLEVVRALGELPVPRAALRLGTTIAEEPYVPVRAEMARLLGRLGDRAAVAPLAHLLTVEKEPPVVAEAVLALARLHALGAAGAAGASDLARAGGWSCDRESCAPRDGTTLPGRAGETLWLVTTASPEGSFRVGATEVTLRPDQRAYPIVLIAARSKIRRQGTARVVAVLRQRTARVDR